MTLTVKEMNMLCAAHSGTLSATLETLRGMAAKDDHQSSARTETFRGLIEKLDGRKDGEAVSIAFDPE